MLRTRFAPSPTGYLHLGNIRTALLSYLWSKNNNADYILRFDDTDRVEAKYIEQIKNDLSWFGIKYDKEIFQSQRNDVYEKWFEICKEKQLIYPAYDTKEELEKLRNDLSKEKKPPVYKKKYAQKKGGTPHWRFELPSIKVEWNDKIRKNISINLKSVSDPIIKKSDKSFTYMFTSVVDDIEEKISHIIRGEDHVTNTAIQIYMFDKMNSSEIIFSHLPILMNKHGQRMSKRNKDESIKDLREEGFMSISLSNQMVFLGKNEFHLCKTLSELQNFSDLEYSSSQIRWSKKELIKQQTNLIQSLSKKEMLDYFGDFDKWDLIKNNTCFKQDFEDWKEIFESKIIVSEEKISFNEKLLNIYKIEDWQNWIESICLDQDRRIVLKNLRLILTGKKFGPTLIELLNNISKDIIQYRLNNAYNNQTIA